MDVMIDLESLGMDVDGVFTSIGAVEFDPDTGSIGRTFHQHITWESAFDAGRTVTPDTIKWWIEQSETAKKDLLKKGLPLNQVLENFKQWLPDDMTVWGNGPIFDIAKLEHAYGGWNSAPWRHNEVMCVKTIRRRARGYMTVHDVPFTGEKHTALADAIHQAKYVTAMWQSFVPRKCL